MVEKGKYTSPMDPMGCNIIFSILSITILIIIVTTIFFFRGRFKDEILLSMICGECDITHEKGDLYHPLVLPEDFHPALSSSTSYTIISPAQVYDHETSPAQAAWLPTDLANG